MLSTSMLTLLFSALLITSCSKEDKLSADTTTVASTTNDGQNSVNATAASTATSSALILESTFESSNFLAGWTNMQHCCDYSVTASSKVARSGGKSIKFDLYKTDAIVSSSKRSEVTRDIEAETVERWYGGSFYLEDYAKDAGMESIIQWHDVDGTTPPLSLQIGNGKLMVVQSFANTGLSSTDLGTATTGKWTDIVFHVKWSASSNGVLEVWKDGVKVVSKTNVRTNSKGGNYLKLGINKWSWAPGGGTSTATHRSLYWDEFRIGNEKASYDIVKPGGSSTTTPPATTPPATNQIPVVNAGAAPTITLPVSTATLAGTASDPDGTITSYTWTKVSGNGGVITNAAAASTTVTGLTAGTYVFNLKVTDNAGATANGNVTVTVNAAVVPPSGVRSNLIVESTFESSNYLANWLNMQHCCDYSITNSSTVARAGSKSVKFDLRRSDPIVSSSVRSEITQDIEKESCERWYGLSYYLSNYTSDNGGESIIQWHDVDGSMPPLSLQVWGSDLIVVQGINGGLIQYNIGKVESNKWMDIVFHVKWSTGTDGILEVWRNGTKLVSKTGIKTNSKGGSYLKVGINKWSWAPGGGSSSVSQRLFYVDELRIGNEKATYNDVKPGN